MVQKIDIRVTPIEASSEASIRSIACQATGCSESSLLAIRILKRSIDARQRMVWINLRIELFVNELPSKTLFVPTEFKEVDDAPQAIVVGAGPAGLFAALRLIELGIRPIVLERGKNVTDRKRDIALITREQKVDPESNYSFGEGGAGAYSDGKLYTRSKKRGSVDRILNLFCQHGASESILVDAHPHIGTDKLPDVIANIRNTIITHGGEVHFETRMDQLIRKGSRLVGVVTADGREFSGPVILATGHSARDVYRMMHDQGIEIEAKGIAMGVRLEHPQSLIDQIQYHSPMGRGEYLPAAEYSYVTQIGGRGVYSFCMCPGGFVVPAASGVEQVVVNGMSPSNRGSRWANSGMVVEIRAEDIEGNDPLRMMRYQEEYERLAYLNGGCRQTAPAQRMYDFVNGKISGSLPETSYTPGIISAPLHFILPDMIGSRLKEGFRKFGQMSRGFLTNEAVLIGVESRTSSPVRIVRNGESLQHLTLEGFFPCGEGAGYAGGIVSAAIDGERSAEAVARYIQR